LLNVRLGIAGGSLPLPLGPAADDDIVMQVFPSQGGFLSIGRKMLKDRF